MRYFQTFCFVILLMGTLACTQQEKPTMVELAFNDNPMLGDKNAPVQLIIFTDFECTYCSQLARTLDEIKDTYLEKNQLRLQIWDFPLESHEYGIPAAKCAYCAEDQGAYWEMYQLLYANQDRFEESTFLELAGQLELDLEKFQTCMEGDAADAKVRSDITTGEEIGVSGTPGFILNGQMYSGAPPKDILIELINQELAK